MNDQPRTFHLQRDEDVTGASGTGRVADGVQWPDGTVTVKWRGEYASEVSWPKGMDAVERIHGHDGRTVVVWHDPAGPDLPREIHAEIVLAGLQAMRCIPDGEIVSGCCHYDGSKVRDRFRAAVRALIDHAKH